MIAMMHLQDAARVAQQHHLHDLYGDVVSRLQALSGSDLGMAQIKVPVQLDEAAIEAWFDQITGQTSWEAALVELLRSGPPTGQVEANREFAEQMPSIAPLLLIFPTMGMGPDGLPRYTASSDDADNYLSQVEMHRLQITGPLWAEAFRRIGEKWSPMDLDELSTFLGQGLHVPDDVARALGRSVIRHFEGHHEAAAFTALPRLSGSLGRSCCSWVFQFFDLRAAGRRGPTSDSAPLSIRWRSGYWTLHGLGSSLRCWRATPVRTFVTRRFMVRSLSWARVTPP